jgi:hypothetical protein
MHDPYNQLLGGHATFMVSGFTAVRASSAASTALLQQPASNGLQLRLLLRVTGAACLEERLFERDCKPKLVNNSI